jgi:alcohol dehydrogenase
MDRVIAHELELYGSHGMAAHEYPAMLQMIADGRLRPGDLVGRVIGLEDAGRALAEMSAPGITMIEP